MGLFDIFKKKRKTPEEDLNDFFNGNGKSKEKNQVEFYYIVNYDDEFNSVGRIYKILLRSKKRVRAIISGGVEHRGQIYDDLIEKLSK